MAEVFGIEVPGLPEDIQPIELIVIVKGLRTDKGAEGEFPYCLASRISNGLSTWEAVGMAEWAKANALKQLTGTDEDSE